MASCPPARSTAKPTFAKIAAKGVAPTHANQNALPSGKVSKETVPVKAVPNAHTSNTISPKTLVQKNPQAAAIVEKTSSTTTEKFSTQGGHEIPQKPQVQISARSAGDVGPAEISAKTPTDDGSTHISSSESSVKMPSFDKQSVTSGTTFALDEKESLRPDDSASIRAIEEDSLETGATGSRVGSDTDARAFSDQLNKIALAGNMPPRAILQPSQRPNIMFGSLQSNPVEEPQVALVHDVPVVVQPAPDAPPIDEKLMDALSSPRDRVFILKIEQDVLDFIKNEKDIHLTLPDCNSFYRMLAHRLADYYGLEHTHHPRDSGTAVLISKTGRTRVPPPLSGFALERQTSTPPPATRAARKIMRRGDEGKGTSGASTTANSAGASKATSDAGDGSETGKPKDKSAMTREEREAMYNEARLRIFGTEDPDAQEGKKSGDEHDHSRSSSASGKKKTKKRRDDDDFEPRSQFPGYHQQSLMNNGYSDGTFYFPQYPGVMTGTSQYQMPQAASSPPMMFPNGYSQVDVSTQMQYIGAQQYGSPPANAMTGSNYVQSPIGNHDISSQFQQMSLANPGPHPGTQKSHSPNFAATQHMQPQQGWQANYDSLPYGYGQAGYPTQYPDRSMSSPAQGQPIVPYTYGHLSTALPTNDRSMHPAPGSFNRQAPFNPQTQAFIPGGNGARAGAMPMVASQGNSPYFNPFSMPPSLTQQYRPNPQSHGVQHRPTPPVSKTSTFGSPAGGHSHLSVHNVNTSGMQMNYPPINHNLPHSAPPGTVTPGTRPSHPDNRLLAHPLPQLPNPESSIAKWGTPSHLPPKPPTPTDPHPHKFIDINKGLPARAPITGLTHKFIGSPQNGSLQGS